MKRSKTITLLFAAAAAGGLAGCAEEEPQYFSYSECVANYDRATCDTALDAAKAERDQNAPRFASVAACEEFAGAGMCEIAPAAAAAMTPPAPGQPSSSLADSVVPALLGFAVGSAMGGSASTPYGAGYYAGPPADCDRYDNHQDCRRSGGGGFAAYSTSSSTRPTLRAATPQPTLGAPRLSPAPSLATPSASAYSYAYPQAARIAPAQIYDTRISGARSTATHGYARGTPAAARASTATTTRGGFGTTGRGFSGSAGS